MKRRKNVPSPRDEFHAAALQTVAAFELLMTTTKGSNDRTYMAERLARSLQQQQRAAVVWLKLVDT